MLRSKSPLIDLVLSTGATKGEDDYPIKLLDIFTYSHSLRTTDSAYDI
jgi:hypothetical protein